MISWHVQGPEENNERSSQQNDLKIVQKVTQFSSSFLLCNILVKINRFQRFTDNFEKTGKTLENYGDSCVNI